MLCIQTLFLVDDSHTTYTIGNSININTHGNYAAFIRTTARATVTNGSVDECAVVNPRPPSEAVSTFLVGL